MHSVTHVHAHVRNSQPNQAPMQHPTPPTPVHLVGGGQDGGLPVGITDDAGQIRTRQRVDEDRHVPWSLLRKLSDGVCVGGRKPEHRKPAAQGHQKVGDGGRGEGVGGGGLGGEILLLLLRGGGGEACVRRRVVGSLCGWRGGI